MRELPTLQTERLTLRPFTMDDVPALFEICNDADVASTTLTLPYPYALSDAEQWIPKHAAEFASDTAMTLAISLRETGTIVGDVALRLCPEHERAEMGYLMGKAYWNRGYCTEAVLGVLRYGFAELKLNRIFADHFARNPASGRVMQKAGMRCEGTLRQHLRKLDGRFEDAVCYGILRSEAAELLT